MGLLGSQPPRDAATQHDGRDPDRWLEHRIAPVVVPLNIAQLLEDPPSQPGQLGINRSTPSTIDRRLALTAATLPAEGDEPEPETKL
jgi:hypothetical protein